MTTLRERFGDFIELQRKRFTTRHGNCLALSVGQVLHYRDFLAILLPRYESATDRLIAASAQLQDATESDGDIAVALSKHTEAFNELHLEIESFYLFGDILLDKTARFVEDYFGKARKLSLASHNKLVDHIEGFCSAKELDRPSGLKSKAEGLEKLLSEYRDKQIAHQWNPRTVRGIVHSTKGSPRARATSMVMYPRDDEKGQTESGTPDQLIQQIDTYLSGAGTCSDEL